MYFQIPIMVSTRLMHLFFVENWYIIVEILKVRWTVTSVLLFFFWIKKNHFWIKLKTRKCFFGLLYIPFRVHNWKIFQLVSQVFKLDLKWNLQLVIFEEVVIINALMMKWMFIHIFSSVSDKFQSVEYNVEDTRRILKSHFSFIPSILHAIIFLCMSSVRFIEQTDWSALLVSKIGKTLCSKAQLLKKIPA